MACCAKCSANMALDKAGKSPVVEITRKFIGDKPMSPNEIVFLIGELTRKLNSPLFLPNLQVGQGSGLWILPTGFVIPIMPGGLPTPGLTLGTIPTMVGLPGFGGG